MTPKQPIKVYKLNFPVLIFFICQLFTVLLWNHYFNSEDALDRDVASLMVLIMGSMFAVSAGLFSWMLDSRRIYLEKEIHQRTLRLFEKDKEAREEKERLGVTLRSIGDGVVTTDIKGAIVLVNEAAESLLGYTQEDAWGKALDQVVSIFDTKANEKYEVKNLLSGKNIEAAEAMALISKDGTRKFIAVSSAPIRNEREARIGTVLVFHNVTADKATEQQLRWAEERYRTLFDNSLIAITVTDAEERIVLWNKHAETLLEMEPDDLNLKHVSVLYPEEEWRRLRQHSIRKKGMLNPIETKMIKKGGQAIDVELAVTVLRSPEGEVTGSIGLARSINERKEIDHMREEFIGMASHELRPPMGGMRESIAKLLEGVYGETTDAQKQVLGGMRTNVQRLYLLIDDILALVKIEAGRAEFRREFVDLRDLAKEAGAALVESAETKGLAIKYNFSDQPLENYIDREKISRVFANLINNAVKHTDQGFISLWGTEKEDCIEISVADTGCGIASEDLPKMFRKFQQIGPRRSFGEKGTGLGLAICKAIVNMHGGKIWVESKFGEGTKFSFTLPKLSATKMFSETVSEALQDSLKTGIPFSVLTFDLKGLFAMRDVVGADRLPRWGQDLERLISGTIGMRGYVVRDGISKIWVLFRLGKITTAKFQSAIEEVIAAYWEKEGIMYGIKIDISAITFLDDISSEEEFLIKVMG